MRGFQAFTMQWWWEFLRYIFPYIISSILIFQKKISSIFIFLETNFWIWYLLFLFNETKML